MRRKVELNRIKSEQCHAPLPALWTSSDRHARHALGRHGTHWRCSGLTTPRPLPRAKCRLASLAEPLSCRVHALPNVSRLMLRHAAALASRNTRVMPTLRALPPSACPSWPSTRAPLQAVQAPMTMKIAFVWCQQWLRPVLAYEIRPPRAIKVASFNSFPISSLQQTHFGLFLVFTQESPPLPPWSLTDQLRLSCCLHRNIARGNSSQFRCLI